MPLTIIAPDNVPEFPLEAKDLKEGEVYQDTSKDWLLVTRILMAEEEVRTLIFSPVPPSEVKATKTHSIFPYTYRFNSNRGFRGPYRATLSINVPSGG